ncbi:MAG: hypothetical protein LBU06_10490 [Desulfovibrio sp.]|jgi:hypothetical protein|nr:hypothetical protein [Desulfovibrio sp.]
MNGLTSRKKRRPLLTAFGMTVCCVLAGLCLIAALLLGLLSEYSMSGETRPREIKEGRIENPLCDIGVSFYSRSGSPVDACPASDSRANFSSPEGREDVARHKRNISEAISAEETK